MPPFDLRECLHKLGLSQTEAARLLSVNDRTVRRWVEMPLEISGPAKQALEAWLRLQRFGLAWRPDSESLGENEVEIADQIARLRSHNIDLDAMIREVKTRGGPISKFTVDLKAKKASNDVIEVGFHALPNGGFSPASYRRLDSTPNPKRDVVLLQDAYFCIAQAIAKAGRNWFLA